jgi:hypothetical protein
MSIFGPQRRKKATSIGAGEIDLTPYAKKIEVLSKSGGRMTGRINMGSKKLVEVGYPTERNDAATMGYVSELTQYLNNHKLSKDGDSMTGNLDMGTNLITNVGNPLNEGDVITKRYLDEFIEHDHEINIHMLGRFAVFPGENGGKTYMSVRAKKNINLTSGLQFQLKNNTTDPDENEFNNNPRRIGITKDVENLPSDKTLGVMRLNSILLVNFHPGFPEPLTLFFSAKPGESPPIQGNSFQMTFYYPALTNYSYLEISWDSGTFNYTIRVVRGNTRTVDASYEVDTTVLNHFAFEYTGDRICLWINGVQNKFMNDLPLGELRILKVGVKELGNLSFYNRNLSKTEIIQHFIEYHVENFTDDDIILN